MTSATPRSNAARRRRMPWRNGYLDLLGDDAPDSTGVTQDLMLTRVVPIDLRALVAPDAGVGREGRDRARAWPRRSGSPVYSWASPRRPGARRGLRAGQLLARRSPRAAGDDGLVVGIDASQTMLARGAEDTRKAGVANLALIRGDATALPFETRASTASAASRRSTSSPTRSTASTRCAAVLAPGGRIAIMTSIRRPVTVRPMKPVVERLSGMRVFEPDEITGALAERGFDRHPPPRLGPGAVRRRPPDGLPAGYSPRTAVRSRCRDGRSVERVRAHEAFGVVGDLRRRSPSEAASFEQVREGVLLALGRRQRGEVVVLALEVRDEYVLREGDRIVTGGRPLGILLERDVGNVGGHPHPSASAP